MWNSQIKKRIRSDILADKIVWINFKRTQYGPKGGGQDARNKTPHNSLSPQLVQWGGAKSKA